MQKIGEHITMKPLRRHRQLLIAVVMAGCGCGHGPVETTSPLIDEEHGAAILTEARELADPRSVEQNRLLRGWRFNRRIGKRPLLRPTGTESVIELTQIEPRDRALIIELANHPPGSTVSVATGDRHLGAFPLSERVEIPLPDDLPPGRVTATLTFSDPDRVAIKNLMATSPRTAGVAEVDSGGLTQSGWTAIEVTRRVTGGARFVADFTPPERPQPGQSFSLTLERRAGEAIEVFRWPTSPPSAANESQTIDVDLRPDTGLVRFRFTACGTGPAARWKNLRITETLPTSGRLPEVEPGEPPRLVILYVMDALRADHVGKTGLTPVLDDLASEGVRFTNHFAVAPNTPPSTRALFSGLTLLDDRQLPHPGPTRLAEAFHATGFRTASVTGNPHLGPELDLAAGFEFVELIPLEEDHHPTAMPTVNNNAEVLHHAALRLIRALPPGERGFLYLHTMNPHNPYTPPPEIEAVVAPPGPSTIDGRTRTLVAVRDEDRVADENDRHRLRQLFATGVAYNDRELGRFMTALQTHIDPEDVLLVATSDHGEELFEHGGVLHGHTLYDELLRIPLIVHWPGRILPQAVSAPTTTLDVHASLLEIPGDSPRGSTGSSLWPELVDRTPSIPVDRLVFAAAPGLEGATMARSARRKLILAPRNGPRRGQGNGLGRTWDLEYVFDLKTDSGETDNIAGCDDLEVAWLRTRLLGWTKTQRALQPSPGDMTMSQETRDQLEALGYVLD